MPEGAPVIISAISLFMLVSQSLAACLCSYVTVFSDADSSIHSVFFCDTLCRLLSRHA